MNYILRSMLFVTSTGFAHQWVLDSDHPFLKKLSLSFFWFLWSNLDLLSQYNHIFRFCGCCLSGNWCCWSKVDALEMERMLMVGLLCVHPDSEKRPRVRDAARILNCLCMCSPSVCRTLAHASSPMGGTWLFPVQLEQKSPAFIGGKLTDVFLVDDNAKPVTTVVGQIEWFLYYLA